MPLRKIPFMLLVAVAVLSLMTGCKSSRGGSKGSTQGSSYTYNPAKDRATVERALGSVDDPMARALILEAEGWLGTKYVYGGQTKQGTDCSGLVMSIFRDVCEIKIPRTTRDQVRYCTRVARNKMRPGDLVFFGNNGGEETVSHVGLYIGDGRMIHASSSRGVMVSTFDSGYWSDRYFSGARVDGAPTAYARRTGRQPVILPERSPVQPENEPLQAAVTPAKPVAASPVVDAPSSVVTPTATVSVTPEVAAPEGSMTIDLLDLIINQKVDSIANSAFVD